VVEEVDGGSVWMEREGRPPVRRRLAAGGLREGEVLMLRDRPVGFMRAGGRNEGEASWPDMLGDNVFCLRSDDSRCSCRVVGLWYSHCSLFTCGRRFAVLAQLGLMGVETVCPWFCVCVDGSSAAIRDRR
jgi:hypothetical protein